MKHARCDWGMYCALALALVAAMPFLVRPGLPHQTDAELHVYRAAELGHTLRAGAFYPRWLPDLYYGYGYPLFNYYAPLTYYLANLFDLLPGVGIVGGVKAVFVLGLALASLGAYWLGRELFGPVAGTLAAASFVFSPYVVFIDPHARGDLAEHFAICLLPVVFFAFHRLMRGVGGRWALLASVLALAAVVLAHALIGLVAGVLLLAYWLWWLVFLAAGRRRAAWGLLVFVLAAGLIAFYWLPFLLERSAVKLQVVGEGHFDFRGHFVSLGGLLAPSRVLDLGATAPRFRYNLGVAQWLLALPALGVLWRCLRGKARRDMALLYFALVALGLVFAMLPVSAWLWERIPGVPYLQFPWRLLGPANLMLAICGAGGLGLISGVRWKRLLSVAGLVGILLTALPVLYPPAWAPDFGPTKPLDIIAWEQQGSRALGTTSTGDFEPVTVLAALNPAPSLLQSYTGPGPIDRVNRATLPEGAEVEIVEQRALYDRFTVRTPHEFVFRMYLFHFPGWQVYVDGEPVEIEIGYPEGFITFWVPAGEHEVIVQFEDTPPRVAGWGISAAALIALVAAVLLAPLTARADAKPRSLWALGGLAMLASFVLFKAVAIDGFAGGLYYASPPGQAWAAGHELRVDFGGQIELLGYDLPRQRVRPGGTLPLVLYWHALVPPDQNYQTFVHLARPVDRIWAQEDHLNPGERHGGFPTADWPLDKYVWDEYEVPIPDSVPPGEYVLNVGLHVMEQGYRLPVYDQTGDVAGDGFVIASIEVVD